MEEFEKQLSPEPESPRMWFAKPWFAVLLLFLFPPAGIIMLWKFNHFGMSVRLVLSIFFGLLFLVPFAGNDSRNKPAATQVVKGSNNSPTKQVSTQKPPVAKESAEVPPAQPAAQTVATTEQKDVPGTLGMTPEQFRKEFNRAARELDFPYTIKSIKVKEGSAQDVFQYMFNDYLGLTATVNKQDGSVRDVIILGQTDGTLTSATNFMLAMGVLIEATNPELPAAERGQILTDIGFLGDDVDMDNLDGETVRNGIRYSIMSSSQIGFMFTAGDANDQ